MKFALLHPAPLLRRAIALLTCLWAAGVTASDTNSIPAWNRSHGRAEPIVAIVGDNRGTELTDFVVPYSVLKRAGIKTFALATHEGPLTFRPALTGIPDSTTAAFDAKVPAGADYVIVPAVVESDDPTLLSWLQEQSRKGATLVSICDGALVLANAGLLDGKRATAHWASESMRRKHFPNTQWLRDVRYVADGNVVSSAGISAAMPTSIALVAAISGKATADALAKELGVADWSPAHDTGVFRPHFGNLTAFGVKLLINPHLRRMQTVGVPLAEGFDELALAVTADAFARTGRSRAISVGSTATPMTSRRGLVIVPDVTGNEALDITLPAIDDVPPGAVFGHVLAAVDARFGWRTAYGVALDFEYPGFVR